MENKQYFTLTINNKVRPRGTRSISNVEIKVSPYRGSGNTSRAVDAYIQQLFNEGMTCLVDPHEGGRHRNANEVLVKIFKERMRLEHKDVPVKYLSPSSDTNEKWYAILGK